MSDAGPIEQGMPSPPLAGDAAVPVQAAPAVTGDPAALRRSALHTALGLGIYPIVALGLIGWSLRRGRLSDAILLLVALVVTLPAIVSYRAQVLRRLRAINVGAGEAPPSGDGSGNLPAPGAEGAAPSPRAEA